VSIKADMMNQKNNLKDFPRKLSNRNPNNSLDLAVALYIIDELSTNVMTKETANELAKEGISPNSLIKSMEVVTDLPSEDFVILCAPYSHTANINLIFSDNHIVECDGCSAQLQIRPNADILRARKLCYFCGAQAALDEYWQEQDIKQ
jgi:hypothetical protein